MKKLIKLKLNLEAGKATPAPPIGPILGQYGINIISFCKEYNNKTELYLGLKIPVSIIFFDPKKITIKVYTPSLSYLISFLSVNNFISINNIKKILNIKKKEFYPNSTKKCLFIIKGVLKSMNINIQKYNDKI